MSEPICQPIVRLVLARRRGDSQFRQDSRILEGAVKVGADDAIAADAVTGTVLEYSEGPLKGAYRVPVRATPKRRETRENLRCLV